MNIQEPLCLRYRLEPSHTPFSNPRGLMRKLGTIVGVGSPKVMQLATYLHEHCIDEQHVAVALIFSSQSPGIVRPELVAPKADCFVADSDASFRQKVFDVAVTQVESMVKPDGIPDDFTGETESFVHS